MDLQTRLCKVGRLARGFTSSLADLNGRRRQANSRKSRCPHLRWLVAIVYSIKFTRFIASTSDLRSTANSCNVKIKLHETDQTAVMTSTYYNGLTSKLRTPIRPLPNARTVHCHPRMKRQRTRKTTDCHSV